MSSLWIGTYPVAGAGTPVGQGEGIWRADLVDGVLQDARQVVQTPSPSFLALHPSGTVLYAANEQTVGTISAFDVVGDGLVHRATVPSGGDDPCHLLLDTDGRALLVANYSSGSLAVLPLDEAGGFAGEVRVLGHAGAGPHPQRQEGPHAHFVAHAPGSWVLVVDLGTDEIRRYGRGPQGLHADGIAATFPPGTGPRHLTFDEDGHVAYVVGELDVTVRVLAWDAASGTGTLVQTVPAVERTTDGALPSHVVLDGRRLLVGTRTADVVAEFATGDDGLLEHVADHALPGRWPRHFEVVDGWTVVADQVSGDVAVLAADGSVRGSWPLPSPACVVPAHP
ncbi:beta-propeller fold lactonase family protein [Cellulomonas sp. URHD0024]|uniref:lactonase family protein n=1 Tax=Cellulomonas sp. URHD0024 TaxID=1302620 RepID=UPI000409D131|nr:beta-propeller fold lactonase family protein [Cellulomonas sp. URHD0024]